MVQDVLAEAMMGQPVLDHYVHLETHFDHTEVHRHITVMVMSTDSVAMISLWRSTPARRVRSEAMQNSVENCDLT